MKNLKNQGFSPLVEYRRPASLNLPPGFAARLGLWSVSRGLGRSGSVAVGRRSAARARRAAPNAPRIARTPPEHQEAIPRDLRPRGARRSAQAQKSSGGPFSCF